MTELDFDELDRAVNNLMNDADTSKSVTPLDSPKQEPFQTSSQGDATTNAGDNAQSASSDNQPVAVPVAAQSPSVQSSSPLAFKRRGRFMDVVHPSSDMKTSSSTSPRRYSSVVIRPMDADSTATKATATQSQGVLTRPDQPETKLDDSVATDVSGFSYLDAPKNDYPDPIDLAMEREKTNVNVPPSAEDSVSDALMMPDFSLNEPDSYNHDESVSNEAMPDMSSGTEYSAQPDATAPDVNGGALSGIPVQVPFEEAPLKSPFLRNTKVEKRPLGGAISDSPDDEAGDAAEAINDIETIESPLGLSDSTDVDTADNSTQLVDATNDVATDSHDGTDSVELPDEVAAVDTHAVDVETHIAPSQDTVIDTDIGDDKDAASEQHLAMPTLPEPHQSNETLATILVPTPQEPPVIESPKEPENKQDDEQSLQEDATSGAIFDTQTYHQPLEHPAKHKSGVGVVIWVLALMIVGALGGAAYFYFTTR